MKTKDEVRDDEAEINQGRRKALSRLGLVASAAYVAPALLTLSASAKAHGSEQSDVSDPSMSEPSMSEPSMSEPSMSEPSMSEPSMSEPSMSEPSMSEPSAMSEPSEPGS